MIKKGGKCAQEVCARAQNEIRRTCLFRTYVLTVFRRYVSDVHLNIILILMACHKHARKGSGGRAAAVTELRNVWNFT